MRGSFQKTIFLASLACAFWIFCRVALFHRQLLFAPPPGSLEDNLSAQVPVLKAIKKERLAAVTTDIPLLVHTIRYNPAPKKKEDLWKPSWTPPQKKKNKTTADKHAEQMRRLHFVNETMTTAIATNGKPGPELLGFLRIPKTGSTSLLTWAANASHSGPHYSCFLGPREQLLPDVFHKGHFLDCPHRVYEKTVTEWASKVLPKIVDTRDGGDYSSPPRKQDFQLRLFTIVRDPFERLVSYFQYVRRIYPTWSFAATPLQNATILADDLDGWLNLLATEDSRAFHLPYQKGALMETDDWDLATRRIGGGGDEALSNVLVVIQECFEASVWLLTEMFPDYFDSKATAIYLQAEQERHNSKSRYQQVGQEQHHKLRQQAKTWFAKDFRFYETAKDQFKVRLVHSKVDREVVDSCLATLAHSS